MDKFKSLGIFLIIFIGFNNVEAQIQCHSCDSTVNPNCATLQDLSQIQQTSCTSNTCSVWIVGVATYRGCGNLVPPTVLAADQNTCSTALCNGIIFPATRRQCRQCSSDASNSACATATNIPQTVCANFVANDECFTIAESNTVAHRGCMSDAATTPGRLSCTANDNYCLKCPTNGCNNTPHLEQNPLFCVICNSATNPNCALEGNGTLSARCGNRLLGRTTQCFAFYDGGSTVRGCTNDVGSPCDSPTANCAICDGANCNVEDYCLVCTTTVDVNCRENTLALEPQLCTRTQGQRGCYRRELPNDVVQRGCASTLPLADFTTCSSNNDQCKICMGQACNVKAFFQTCVTCDSRTNVNCALVNPQTALPTSICEDWMDTCRVWVAPFDNGETIRACTRGNEAIQCLPTTNNCNQCEQSNCNNGVFPVNRRRCHHCSGEGSCQIINNENQLRVCERYNAATSCYSVLNSLNQVVRGCSTDVTDDRSLCTSAGARCLQCAQSDGCNSQPPFSDSNLSCVSCRSTQDESCPWGFEPDNTNTMRCTDNLPLGTQESCYLHINSVTNSVERGCTYTDGTNCSPDQCEDCTTNNCNFKNAIVQSCIKCRSSTFGQSSCSEEGSNIQIPESLCNLALQPFATRGCYVTRHNGDTVRGCVSDLYAEDLIQCQNEQGSCRMCMGPGCNTMRGDGNTIHSLSLVTFISFIVATKNFF